MAYNVLVCSTRKERDLSKGLTDSLRELGFSAQQETLPETQLSKARRERLQKADEVIVMLTETSVANPWVLYEMGAAVSLHKRVTPILVGIGSSDLPPIVQQMPHVSYAHLRRYFVGLRERATNGKGKRGRVVKTLVAALNSRS